MKSQPLREEVEQILSSSKRAMHPREMAARLALDAEEYPELIALLDDLREEGLLKMLPGGRVRSAEGPSPRKKAAGHRGTTEKRQSWEGSLTVNPRGFGFVVSAGQPDVFVPKDAIDEALHGDTVLVTIVRKSSKGLEGRVDGIISRRSPRLSGVVRLKRKSVWLEPDDTRIRGPIPLIAGLEGVGDGDSAVVEIVRFPGFADELPEARVVEILGPPGQLETEVRKILLTAEVREEHEPETLQNAETMAVMLQHIKKEGRRDLRSVPLPTIDPEDARDHDDAIWVERRRGGYRVYVAIADVSEYVREGSPLDEEAHERGCTIYLPDRAVPMLPRALAADLCSLLPEVDRYCLCVIADLNRKGEVRKFEIVEGVMRSQARLTYGGVARALDLDPESQQSPAAEAMKDNLLVLKELSEKLRKMRMQRGALDLDLPEPRVVTDEDTGAPIEVKKRATRAGMKTAYQLVEEMMLLANELVARWMVERDVPAIFRVHGAPDEEKLERLAKVATELQMKVDVHQLSEPRGAAEFLKRAQKHPHRDVLTMLLLRSLKQATYETVNIGHFGLASSAYVHFTSPIRRYPDLRVHRQLKKLLRGGRVDRSEAQVDDLQAAATDSSKKERAAMDVERQVLDLYRAIYMQRHIGDQFKGNVTGISGTGLYVALQDPYCDVLVPFDALGLDQFELDDEEVSVTGRRNGETIMLGDPLELEVTDVAVGRRTVLGRRIFAEEDELVRVHKWTRTNKQGSVQRHNPGEKAKSPALAPQGAGDEAPFVDGNELAGMQPWLGERKSSRNGRARKASSSKDQQDFRHTAPTEKRRRSRASESTRRDAGKREGRKRTPRALTDATRRVTAKKAAKRANAERKTSSKSGDSVKERKVSGKPQRSTADLRGRSSAATSRKAGSSTKASRKSKKGSSRG